MPLKTETNTNEIQERVLDAAVVHPSVGPRHNATLTAVFEHGQWWIVCYCGAQWSVVDATGGDSVDGFGFEQVSEGDGACEEDVQDE